MSSVTFLQSNVREMPRAQQPDDAVWQAWLLKGRAQEERDHAARMRAVKWISLLGLLIAAAAGFWPNLAPSEVIIRFIVATAATGLMFHALSGRYYVFAAVFGAMVLLYNPVVPVLSFSGVWGRSLMVASAIPIIASLNWRNQKLASNV